MDKLDLPCLFNNCFNLDACENFNLFIVRENRSACEYLDTSVSMSHNFSIAMKKVWYASLVTVILQHSIVKGKLNNTP